MPIKFNQARIRSRNLPVDGTQTQLTENASNLNATGYTPEAKETAIILAYIRDVFNVQSNRGQIDDNALVKFASGQTASIPNHAYEGDSDQTDTKNFVYTFISMKDVNEQKLNKFTGDKIERFFNDTKNSLIDYFPENKDRVAKKVAQNKNAPSFEEQQFRALSILVQAFQRSNTLSNNQLKPESGSLFGPSNRSQNQKVFADNFHIFLRNKGVEKERADRIIEVFNKRMEVVVLNSGTICAFKGESAIVKGETRGIGILISTNNESPNVDDNTNTSTSTSMISYSEENFVPFQQLPPGQRIELDDEQTPHGKNLNRSQKGGIFTFVYDAGKYLIDSLFAVGEDIRNIFNDNGNGKQHNNDTSTTNLNNLSTSAVNIKSKLDNRYGQDKASDLIYQVVNDVLEMLKNDKCFETSDIESLSGIFLDNLAEANYEANRYFMQKIAALHENVIFDVDNPQQQIINICKGYLLINTLKSECSNSFSENDISTIENLINEGGSSIQNFVDNCKSPDELLTKVRHLQHKHDSKRSNKTHSAIITGGITKNVDEKVRQEFGIKVSSSSSSSPSSSSSSSSYT